MSLKKEKQDGIAAELYWKYAGEPVKHVVMNQLDTRVFKQLFRDACRQCFGHDLEGPLSETAGKQLCNEVLEQTGLVIGAKSVKNYAAFVLHNAKGKSENPSFATLDTLARYVLNAPYTTEPERKEKESHYPWWFRYKEQFYRAPVKPSFKKRQVTIIIVSVVIVMLTLLFFVMRPVHQKNSFKDDFTLTDAKHLSSNGWLLQTPDTAFWQRRSEKPGYLTLFTLRGDNWPEPGQQPQIKNLLLQAINGDCFTAEMQLEQFIPRQNWQQAGLLLLEDTGFTARSVRISLAYNDFFGGYTQPGEVLVQVMASRGKEERMPEEVVHQTLFKTGNGSDTTLVNENLQHTALRIEKQGTQFRFLFANGSMENPAFKEITHRRLDIKPRYIGLFALKGFVDSAATIPAHIKYFSIETVACSD